MFIPPIVSTILYTIASIIFIIALIGRLFQVVAISEEILLLIHTILVLVEGIKQYEEYESYLKEINDTINVTKKEIQTAQGLINGKEMQIVKGENFNSRSPVQLSLIKASWCSACKQYLSSDSFNELQSSIPFPVVFKVYDIDADAGVLNAELGVQKEQIKFVPVFLISSQQGTALYKDSVYDTQKVLSTAMSVLN